jgi:hypothetical protein
MAMDALLNAGVVIFLPICTSQTQQTRRLTCSAQLSSAQLAQLGIPACLRWTAAVVSRRAWGNVQSSWGVEAAFLEALDSSWRRVCGAGKAE